MTYLTENPLPGILIFAFVAVIALLSGSPSGKRIGFVCIACSIGLYFLEQTLVSTGEEVEAAVAEMLDSFRAEDLTAIESQIADASPELIGIATRGLKLVDLSPEFRIKSVETSVSEDEQTVTALIRANGRVNVSISGAGSMHAATYWKTTWIQQDSKWKLKGVTRLDPTNGDEVSILSIQ